MSSKRKNKTLQTVPRAVKLQPVSRAVQNKMAAMEPVDLEAEGLDVSSATFFQDVQTAYPDALIAMNSSVLDDPVMGPMLKELFDMGLASYHDSDGTVWKKAPERTRPVLERAAKKFSGKK
jgi:hypothetical protein